MNARQSVRFDFIGTGGSPIKPRAQILPLAKHAGVEAGIVFEHPLRIPYLDVLTHLDAADAVFIFGGTSTGSPQSAGELALVNQKFGRQGDINPILYEGFARHGYSEFFHDITVGTNTFTGAGSNGKTVTIIGYNTRQGWDPVTGLGSLIFGNTIFGPPGSATTPLATTYWRQNK